MQLVYHVLLITQNCEVLLILSPKCFDLHSQLTLGLAQLVDLPAELLRVRLRLQVFELEGLRALAALG
jgi:hypothetical protein